MYLSKISLRRNILPSELFHDYLGKDIYKYHQLIWKLFNENNPDKKRDFLFRKEFDGEWPIFYTLSAIEPGNDNNCWEIKTKPYLPKINNGDFLYFKLRVNPRICSKNSAGKTVYYDIVQNERYKEKDYQKEKKTSRAELVQQMGTKWLTSRSEGNGFKIISVIVDKYEVNDFPKENEGKRITLSTIDYQGQLQVTDAESFLKVLFKGLGPAKGFGCGLMMVKH
ncbi:MAG: CRISPR-associated protein Cse3 [Bacteroidota bacterium]|nr:CRISPR-associated protein Cse3 [Bacteroidota bacterium]